MKSEEELRERLEYLKNWFEANSEIKKEEKEKKIPEDEAYKSQEEIQKITDERIEKIDDILKKKEKEIRET